MAEAEEQYREDLKAQGIEVPEAKPEEKPEGEEPKAEPNPTAASPEKKDGEAAPDEKEKGDETLQTEPDDQPLPKRSIYDEYKDKKVEAKAYKELAVEALKGRGIALSGKESLEELQEKLKASAPAEKPNAGEPDPSDPLAVYAAKVGADPAALTELRDLILSGVKPPEIDPTLAEQLKDFQEWKSSNAQQVEAALFDKEFTASLPAIKEIFPTAVEADLDAIKGELDRLSHTAELHDKPLDYIAFKHKAALAALITPRKKGMEGKDRKPDADALTHDFDPAADLSKMTPEQREKWSEEYSKLGSDKGLLTDEQGRKIFV